MKHPNNSVPNFTVGKKLHYVVTASSLGSPSQALRQGLGSLQLRVLCLHYFKNTSTWTFPYIKYQPYCRTKHQVEATQV